MSGVLTGVYPVVIRIPTRLIRTIVAHGGQYRFCRRIADALRRLKISTCRSAIILARTSRLPGPRTGSGRGLEAHETLHN